MSLTWAMTSSRSPSRDTMCPSFDLRTCASGAGLTSERIDRDDVFFERSGFGFDDLQERVFDRCASRVDLHDRIFVFTGDDDRWQEFAGRFRFGHFLFHQRTAPDGAHV